MASVTPESFEAALKELVDSGEGVPSDLVDAFKRLREDPSVRRGNGEGGFTYSDPILAQALYAANSYSESDGEVRQAYTPEGSLLRDDPKNYHRWILVGLRAFKEKHINNNQSLISLAARTPSTPVVYERSPVRIAVTGDAGYQGLAQGRVLQMILKRHRESPFQAVIHLGDVYFAAGQGQMLKNFLAPFAALESDGIRVFTLVGNHDLYFGGYAFESALDVLKQPGRYFHIETPDWIIPCLDTSLADPTLRRLDGLLDETQLRWLRGLLHASNRPTAVMSHHFFRSGWSGGGVPLRDQLRDLFAEYVFAWYWGHEHSCATYDPNEFGFYGACVGNGAFLEKWSEPKNAKAGSPSWYAEGKCTCYNSAEHFWPHGFLELELRPGILLETYHLENGLVSPHVRTLITRK